MADNLFAPVQKHELIKTQENNLFAPVRDNERGSGPGVQAKAALEGFGNAATFGYLPQIQGGVGAGVDYIANKIDPNYQPDNYVTARDQFVTRKEQLRDEAPLAMAAGEVAGTFATPMPGVGLAKGAATAGKTGLLARFGKAAGQGAIQGALYNPGDVKGEISPLQFEERAVQGLLGGALAGGGQGALGSVQGETYKQAKALRKLAKKIEKNPNLIPAISGGTIGAGYLGAKALKGDLEADDVASAVLAGGGVGLINKLGPKIASKGLKTGAKVVESKAVRKIGKLVEKIPPRRLADLAARGLLPTVEDVLDE